MQLKLSGFGVVQAIHKELEFKLRHHHTNEAVNDRCKVERADLHEGNLYPPSLHICLGVAGCPSAESCMYHVCPTGCHRFEKLCPQEFEAHSEDKCPTCEAPRFERDRLGHLVPCRVMFDFGVSEVIRDLFKCHDWTALRDEGRGEEGEYYKSPEAVRLHREAGVLLTDRDGSVYELGLDWLQPYDTSHGNHSMGITCLRCGFPACSQCLPCA